MGGRIHIWEEWRRRETREVGDFRIDESWGFIIQVRCAASTELVSEEGRDEMYQ
jgi:hypothetical protein